MPAALGRFLEAHPTMFGWGLGGPAVRSDRSAGSDALCAFRAEADPPHDPAPTSVNGAHGQMAGACLDARRKNYDLAVRPFQRAA